jgi:hypothetical protein
MRALLLAVLATAALSCLGNGFTGEENQILFNSNLGRAYSSWSPSVPVAVGAELHIYAFDYQPHDAGVGAIAPRATPSVDGGDIFEAVDAGLDSFTARVARPGAARLDWNGITFDHFVVHAREAEDAGIEDPVLTALRDQTQFDISRSALWPVIQRDFLLAAGRSLFVDVALWDDAGVRLAHSPNQVQPRVSGPLHAEAFDTGVVVSSDGGAGEVSDVALTVDGRTLGSFRVRTGSASDVTRVDVRMLVVPPNIVLLKATARVDGGEELWQAHVRWAYDPHLRDMGAQNGSPTPEREDLLALTWTPGDAGTIRAPIYVGVGSIEQMVELEIPVDGLNPITEGPVYVPKPCSCATTPGFPLLLGALLLIRRRR